MSGAPVSTLILACRERRFRLNLRRAITNNLYSQARSCAGFSTFDEDEQRRVEQSKHAKAMVDALLAGEETEAPDAVRVHVMLAAPSLAAIAENERALRKLIEKTAVALPVWDAWGKAVRGFGAFGLGLIVGEAGDLALYSNPAKLWKRMGLAVMDGRAQGRPEKGAGAEEWIEHGYNPLRRSVVWTIGDALIKQGEAYRTIYLERKELEAGRCETKMHAHRRAQRFMEKRLLRDLWVEWRRAAGVEPAVECIEPAAGRLAHAGTQ